MLKDLALLQCGKNVENEFKRVYTSYITFQPKAKEKKDIWVCSDDGSV